MPQTVTKVTLEDFRSYDRFESELSPGLTVIVGPNATGKTNLIEAIQLATATESFRRPKWEDVVATGCAAAVVAVTASGPEGLIEIEMRISRETGRSYTVNGKKKKPQSIPGRIPSVVFSPDDLYMIKGPAEERRRAVDEAGDQLSSTYGSLRRE
ncbi:MAG: AAA family ATPase, partial [Armatimonadota bacterium]